MFNTERYKLVGNSSFKIGIFLLAAAPIFSALFFLISLLISFIFERKKIIVDKFSLILVLAGILMIFVSLYHFINYENLYFSIFSWNGEKEVENIVERNQLSSLVGLSNWIPFFVCFFGFQPYLRSENNRKIAAKFFVAGSIPVLISGFGQYFFKWHGPLELFNGLIIWFQKPNSYLSGLFSNQNYTGCWLNIILPFSVAIFFEKTKNFYTKGTTLLFVLSITLSSFLTFSRNAWAGLLICIPLVLGPTTLYWFIPIIILLITTILIKFLDQFPENISLFFNSILPNNFDIFNQFSSESYTNENDKRYVIFVFALKMIFKNPLLGLGAASFPFYYFTSKNIYKGHPHNLIIDLAFNYGLIITLLVFGFIFLILIFSLKKLFFSYKKFDQINYFERAWISSFLILLISQMFDVQYYDGRIAISFWILLTGLRCLINKDEKSLIDTI